MINWKTYKVRFPYILKFLATLSNNNIAANNKHKGEKLIMKNLHTCRSINLFIQGKTYS